jgi:arylsulfatase A-like enzyme
MPHRADSTPAMTRLAPLWLAVHVGVGAAAADLLAQVYHGQASLNHLRLTLGPALVAGAVAGLLFFVIGAMLGRIIGSDRGGGITDWTAIAVSAGIVVGALEWLEARPYLYGELPRLLTFGNLLVAVGGHVLLSLRRAGEGRMRRGVLGATILSYGFTAVCLGTWFYFVLLEERLGYEAAVRIQRVVAGAGSAVFIAGLMVVAVGVGALGAGWRPCGRAARLLLAPLPYVLMTIAVYRWGGSVAPDADIPAGVWRLLWGAPVLAALAVVTGVMERGARGMPWPAMGALALGAMGFLVVFRAPLADRMGLTAYRAEGRELRRIVLVTSDTLRADVLEAYGGTEIRTPRLNELAEASIVFDEPIAPAPWTLPSFAAMFTGLMPGAYGAIEIDWRLGEEPETLAGRLSEAGYYTAAIGLNPLLLPRHGLDRGFATYEYYPRERRARTLGGRVLAWARPVYFRTDPTSEELTELALDWLARHGEKDFFFWLHYYDPHTPLGPPEPFRPEGEGPASIVEPWERSLEIKRGTYVPGEEERAWLRQLYLAEVRYVDWCVGRLLDGLKELGLYEDALIIFASDHGEEFWEHGGYGHGQSLFHELIHVPLMVKLPGAGYRGRVAQPVSTASLMPTILEMTGLEFDPERLSAPSVAGLLRPTTGTVETEPVYSETSPRAYSPHRRGARFGEVKFIEGHGPGHPHQMYDLRRDPGEKENVAATRPEEAARGLGFVEAYIERNEALVCCIPAAALDPGRFFDRAGAGAARSAAAAWVFSVAGDRQRRRIVSLCLLEGGDDFGEDAAGGVDSEDVDEAGLEAFVDDVAVDRPDAGVAEAFGIVGERPDFIPEEFAFAQGEARGDFGVAGGGEAGFLDGEAVLGAHFFAIDPAPEVERAFLAVHDDLGAEADDEGVEVNDVALDFVFLFDEADGEVAAGGNDEEEAGEEAAVAFLLS